MTPTVSHLLERGQFPQVQRYIVERDLLDPSQ
jgi:hypothetical protein